MEFGEILGKYRILDEKSIGSIGLSVSNRSFLFAELTRRI